MATTSIKRLEGGGSLAGVQLGMQEESVCLKTTCAIKLNDDLDSLSWTQLRIASELGLSQPHVSELRNYRLDRLSADRLLHFMAALGLQVTIDIKIPRKAESTESEDIFVRIPVRTVKKLTKRAA